MKGTVPFLCKNLASLSALLRPAFAASFLPQVAGARVRWLRIFGQAFIPNSIQVNL
jgi:hypothetical protein